jgi:hypothetical protein
LGRIPSPDRSEFRQWTLPYVRGEWTRKTFGVVEE